MIVVLAVSGGFVIGCGGSGTPAPQSNAGEGQQKSTSVSKTVSNSPEMKLVGMKSSKDKVDYFKKLNSDPNFDPKLHQPMLESYAKDKDTAVAAAAKELLDKVN